MGRSAPKSCAGYECDHDLGEGTRILSIATSTSASAADTTTNYRAFFSKEPA